MARGGEEDQGLLISSPSLKARPGGWEGVVWVGIVGQRKALRMEGEQGLAGSGGPSGQKE